MSKLAQWLSFPHQTPDEPVVEPAKAEKINVEIIITLLHGDNTRTTGVHYTYTEPENFPEVPANVFEHFEKWFANADGDQDNHYVFEGEKFKTAFRRQDIVMYQITVHRS